MNTWRLFNGDVRDQLRLLPDRSVQTCVTSPPYWGLRDYGSEPTPWGGDPACAHEWGDKMSRGVRGEVGERSTIDGDQDRAGNRLQRIQHGQFCQTCGAWLGALGLEPTPELFVEHLVAVFAEVSRVLADDGTCWVNLGDCYATGAGSVGECPGGGAQGDQWRGNGRPAENGHGTESASRRGYKGDRGGHEGKHQYRVGPMTQPNRLPIPGLKTKDLVGVPWRFAFAAQAAGWYLRADIIWNKPNPMPESIKDRPTKAHEYIFLLTKRERYFYDYDAVREPYAESTLRELRDGYDGEATKDNNLRRNAVEGADYDMRTAGGRNKRSVWTIPTKPYPDAHFATYPPELIEPCILAGSRIGDSVLDPFAGSGTTGEVALKHGRSFVGIELNPQYVQLARRRLLAAAPLFSQEATA